MKKIVTSIILIISLIALSACNSEVIVKTKVGNITENDLYEELKSSYGEETLENMIVLKVLEDKYTVSEEDEQFTIQNFKDELGPQFQMWLFQNGIQSEESEEFKEVIRPLALMEKLQFDGIEVTDEEMQEKFDELVENREIGIRASHILIKVDEDEKDDDKVVAEKKKTAEDVLEKLNNGEDFEELAKEYSDDSSASRGGDLGYFKTNEMVPEFEEAAFNLDVGEISDIVESDFGFHIIKVTDIPTFEDSKGTVRYKILQSKVDEQEVVNRYQQILKDAKIEIKNKDFEQLQQRFQFSDPVGETPNNNSDITDAPENENNNQNNNNDNNSDSNNNSNTNNE